jgi:predicted RNA-binding protein with PIN domain
MIIVVDAYNFLRAIPPYKKTITDQERAKFITQLGTYGRRKGHRIVIVFDGGPHEWPFKENTKRVTVVYSGIHESADDYIKEYIEEHRSKDLLLVSSDNELNRFAARLTITSIDSAAFYELVRQELSIKQSSSVRVPQDQVVKIADDTTDDIDKLMMEASKNVPVKSEDFVHDKKRTIKSNPMDKNDRALLKKLNKL